MSDPSYVTAPLFGGAMRVDLPQGFSDMSRLRQIPDHQEVYASDTTRTNIIVEITERVERSELDSVTNNNTSNASHDENARAVMYHLNDICEANDDTYELLDEPKSYPIPNIAAHTWTAQALVSTRARVPHPTPGGGVQNVEQDVTATVLLFVVRLARQKADILAHINVPHEELQRTGDPNAVGGEVLKAQAIMIRMMDTLEIVNYGLFGGEE